jgi:hypothetical protein
MSDGRHLQVVIFWAVAAFVPLAQADDFSFSFTNTVGNVAGTVTGEILGLTDNSTGPAAKVIVESFPAGLNSVLGSAPIDATSWTIFNNSFTETGGQVVAADFDAETGTEPSNLGIVEFNPISGASELTLDGNQAFDVLTFAGLSADNIAPVPEPSSLGLAIATVGLIASLSRQSKALTTTKTRRN